MPHFILPSLQLFNFSLFQLLNFYRCSFRAVDVFGMCDDVLAYALMDGLEGVLYLRYHAAGDDAFFYQRACLALGDEGDDATVIVGIA